MPPPQTAPRIGALPAAPLTPVVLAAPDPIFNCPQCSHWLAPGTLACPDCGAVVYTTHVGRIAAAARQDEAEKLWPQALERWHSALVWLPAQTPESLAVQARIEAVSQRIQGAEAKKATWTKRLGPLAPVAFFLLKAKTFFFALLKFKFFLSFFAFFALYWALFGWRFGLGFAVSILIHEMGHYVALRRRGLKPDLPVFLPGLGAYVRWYSQGISLRDLAAIALAGPFFGLLTAIACLGLYLRTGAQVFAALAHAGAWVNLVNLVPVLGLDGAQATYALSKLQRGLIVLACVVLFGFLREGVFLFIAAGMAWRLFREPGAELPDTRTMVWTMLLLFALGSVLWVVPNRDF